MDLIEFNKLVKRAGLSKKELAELMGSPYSTVNGWGISGKKIPVWVKSWLTNYIELQRFKEAYIKCSDELRELNNDLYEEPMYINEKTTNEEIFLANTLNKIGHNKIVDINDLNPNSISEYLADIIKLNETVRDIQQKQKEEMQEMKKEIETIRNK